MAITSKQVRESLLQQLKAKGANLPHFMGMVDDYVFYFDQVKRMKADIKKKGLTYMATSSVGKEYEKDNPNVKQITQYTRQMLQILKDLGLTTENIPDEDDEL